MMNLLSRRANLRLGSDVCRLTPLSIAVALALNTPMVIAAEQNLNFNIPAQALGSALNAYADVANVQLSYPAELTGGLKSTAVSGALTAQQALQRLLVGTGVVAKSTANGTITLQKLTGADANIATELSAINVSANYDAEAERTRYNTRRSSVATKTDTPLMETPVSVQIIPRAVMDDQQAISVADAVKNVSGVQQSGYSFYDGFSVRGFDADQNTYRNGLRQAQITNLETANLESVEVLKGPAAILFGRIEPGGMVNLVTKKPLDTPYYSVQQQFGSFDLYRTTVDATGPLKDDKSLLYRMNVAYKDNNTFRDFVHQEHVFVAPSLTWRPNERFESNIDIEYQHDEFVEDGSDSGIPAIGRSPANIPINRHLGDRDFNRKYPNRQERVLVGFDWSYQFNKDWKIKNRFQYLDAQYHQSILWSAGPNPDNQTISRGLWHMPFNRTSYGTNLDLTGKFDTGFAHHDILVGFDLYRLNSRDQEGGGYAGMDPLVTDINIYNPSYGLDLSSLVNQKSYFFDAQDNWIGVYFQDHIKLWDKLHLMGGGRHDWTENGYGEAYTSHADVSMSNTRSEFFSPRVGLLYEATPWLSVYGNFVESIGSNNSGRSESGTPFGPQTATQFEAGIKTEFFEGDLTSTLAYYDITKQNMLTADPYNPMYSVAIGKAHSNGVEWDITGKLTENLKVIGTYAYTDTRITKDNYGNQGNRLASVPLNSGSVWLKYDVKQGELNGLHLGTGVYVRGQREGDNANSFELPSYGRWDASIGYSFKHAGTKITPQLNIYNLLDKTYYDHSSNRGNIRPGEPLSFLGSVKVEF